MIEISRARRIEAEPGKVWDVVADVRRLPEWYARAARAEILEGEGLGRRQRISGQWRGQESQIDQVVTAFESARRLEWRHEAERLGGLPAPRFAAETVMIIELEPEGAGSTRVVLTSRQLPADPEKEAAMRGNSDYLGQMFEVSLERLDELIRAS
jgi:uncharacterized protein YndB with AHSA1/START domain